VEQPPLAEQVSAQGDGSLGAGEDNADGVGLPGSAAAPIREPTPEIDNCAAIHDDAHRRADLAAFGEVARELSCDRGEGRVAGTLNVRHGASASFTPLPAERGEGKRG